MQQSIPAQMRQLLLHISNNNGSRHAPPRDPGVRTSERDLAPLSHTHSFSLSHTHAVAGAGGDGVGARPRGPRALGHLNGTSRMLGHLVLGRPNGTARATLLGRASSQPEPSCSVSEIRNPSNTPQLQLLRAIQVLEFGFQGLGFGV